MFIFSRFLVGQEVLNNKNCQSSYEYILSLRFEEAQEIINVEKQNNPNNLFIVYLENYIDFLKVTISENETIYSEVEPRFKDNINKIKQLPDSSSFKNYFLGNMYLQWATIDLRFGNYFSGAIELNKAYRLLEKNNSYFPDFFPNKITLGVLHIMIGVVPDSYTWLLDLISVKGTVSQGKNELKTAYHECSVDTNYNFLVNEIIFYMGMVDLGLSPDPTFAGYLVEENNNRSSLLMTYLVINYYLRNGYTDKALTEFLNIDRSINYYPFYYLNYLAGECLIRKLETGESKDQYQIFLNNFTGENYIKEAYLKMAWGSLIEGDTNAYFRGLNNILKYGREDTDGDKRAEKYASNKLLPNIELLKTQLLFDGGYYKEADSIIQRIESDNLSLKHSLEKTYRQARIYHKQHNIEKAKKFYKMTIKKGKNFTSYFAANSALMIGNIYESEQEKDSASAYYNICLNMDFDEYYNSITGKAKQGLNRLKKN